MTSRSADVLLEYVENDPEITAEVKKKLSEQAEKAKKNSSTLPEIVYRRGVTYLGWVSIIAVGGAMIIALLGMLPGTQQPAVPDIIVTAAGTALGALAGLLAAPKQEG